jgi:hypothetical protein
MNKHYTWYEELCDGVRYSSGSKLKPLNRENKKMRGVGSPCESEDIL